MTSRAVAATLALALAACAREAPITEETRRREAFVHRVATAEHMIDAWSLMSRSDLIFDEGVSDLEVIDPTVPEHPWYEVARTCAPGRGQAVRWMGQRVLLKVRGDRAARLGVRGHVDLHKLFTRPRVTIAFDGRELYAEQVEPDGSFAFATVVPRAWLDGWSDVYVTLSSVSEPWREPAVLRVARLEEVTWEPAPPSSSAAPE